MNIRTRKAIGVVATVVWLVVYSLVAMAIGGIYVVGLGFTAEISYFVIAGLLWLPVEMIIIRWMSRPDAQA